MIIKKMIATFGRLKNEKLELHPGLNIIEAPNERGKTTWCDFLKSMLYGVDTSERDRYGHLSTKTRYRPWSGAEMVGTMEFIKNGEDITIQRTSKGGAPMKHFVAVQTGTANFLKDLSGDNAGEWIIGAPRSVFERTAFISRPDMRVTQNPELEKRITSLVSTGDETTSFTDADITLRSWQRKIRYNKNGSLPQLEAKLKAAKGSMEMLEDSAEELAKLRGNMDRFRKQLELMEKDLETHTQLEHRAAAQELKKARDSAQSAEERVRLLTDAITKNGHKMTREDIRDIRETAAAVIPLRDVASAASKNLWQAEKELADTARKREASPLDGRSEETVRADIEKAKALENKIRHAKERKIPKAVPTAIIILSIIGLLLCSGLLRPLSEWITFLAPFVNQSIIGVILFALLLLSGASLFFIKLPQRRVEADALSELLGQYGAATADKLESMLDSFSSISRLESEKRAARDSARTSYETANNAAQEASDRAVAELSAFMPEVSSGEAVLEALDETEKLIDQLTQAEFDMLSSESVYETLRSEFTGDEEADLDTSYLPIPLRSREDTLSAMERVRTQLADATRAFDLATGAQRSLGDPAVLQGEIETIQEQITAETRKYDALGLAIDTLNSANDELATRFSPVISSRAGEYLATLTGNRYEKLVFDKGFEAAAKERGETVSRNVLALSYGTSDEVYLSLRLAMCDMLLGGDDPCPIILDDALANFDDIRCRRALDLLMELGRTRQVILFTCHSRERALLSDKNVNIIRL